MQKKFLMVRRAEREERKMEKNAALLGAAWGACWKETRHSMKRKLRLFQMQIPRDDILCRGGFGAYTQIVIANFPKLRQRSKGNKKGFENYHLKWRTYTDRKAMTRKFSYMPIMVFKLLCCHAKKFYLNYQLTTCNF